MILGHDCLPTLSHRMEQMPRSCVRDLMASSGRPDLISFAGGVPAPSCIPVDTIRNAAEHILARHGSTALGYGASEGEEVLRSWIADVWLPRKGIRCSSDEILIVNGSQQALDLLGKVLLDKWAPIVVERPTYLAALQAFSAYEPEFREVSLQAQGLDVASLAMALRGNSRIRYSGARLFYTVPNFQNPSGAVMSLERRIDVVDELNRHAALLVEDDPYGELYFDEPPPLSLNALGTEQGVFLGTFSKMVAPGFRLGFIRADKRLAHHLGTLKQAADLCTSRFNQLILVETLMRMDIDSHLEKLRVHYRQRRDQMDQALQRHLQGFAHWTLPQGGMFFWIEFAEGCKTRELLTRCAARGVVFADGSSFYADGSGERFARFNFTACDSEQMDRGLAIVAEEVRAMEAHEGTFLKK